jgi:hypothetical protein
MRNLSKYKIFFNSKKIIDNFPKRVALFKRTKWKNFLFFNRSKSRTKIFNLTFNSHLKYKSIRLFKFKSQTLRRYKFKNLILPTVKKGSKKLVRMRKYYKESLLSKIKLLQNFDKSLNISNIRKNILKPKKKSYINLIQLLLIKQNFDLKILLWKLHFFLSTAECIRYMNLKQIQVNDKSVKLNYSLKKGDVITFSKNLFFLDFKKNLQTYKLNPKFYSFIEIDYYTCTLVVIKNFDELNLEDFSLLMPKSFDITIIWNYIR